MDLKDFRYVGEKPNLKKIPQNAYGFGVEKEDKEKYVTKLNENIQEIALLQDKLYAEGKEGVVFVLQAMDAAGKDGTVKHVFSGVNPQGVRVISFKQPSKEELSHDFLWRVNNVLPERGMIAVFNRSHYEDVLVTQVHHMEDGYAMPKRCTECGHEEFYKKRNRQIKDYEKYLYENGYRMVKVFLNVSLEEQKSRFLKRIEDPTRHWKFAAGDLEERQYFAEYHRIYEEVIEKTGTEECPWYIIPADQKWFARYLFSEIVKKTLESCKPKYPTVSEAMVKEMTDCKEKLDEQ